MGDYLGDLAFILIGVVFVLLFLPILIGIGIGLLLGVTGYGLFQTGIIVALLIWCILVVLWNV